MSARILLEHLLKHPPFLQVGVVVGVPLVHNWACSDTRRLQELHHLGSFALAGPLADMSVDLIVLFVTAHKVAERFVLCPDGVAEGPQKADQSASSKIVMQTQRSSPLQG